MTKSIVNVDYFKVHENKDGTVDKTKTDLYLHLVNKNDNSVITSSEVLRLVDQNIEQLDELFKEFNVLDTQSEALVLKAEFGDRTQVVIWLGMVNFVTGVLLIIVTSYCLSQRKKYRRQLKAARVNAYGKFFEFYLQKILILTFSSSRFRQNSNCSSCAKHQQAQL